MDRRSDILICPECGSEHDPQFRFCLQCGSKLPLPKQSTISAGTAASGKASGIEPPADALYEEPSYRDGHSARESGDNSTERILPAYARAEELDESKRAVDEKSIQPASPLIIGTLVIVAIILPPIGIIAGIIEALLPAYRKAALPTIIAGVIGGGLWGWVFWFETKNQIYNDSYMVLQEYIESQDWANESIGHYLPLLELQTQGFLPVDFPPESKLEYTVVEHVLGPSGYVVEIRPGDKESRIYGIDPLWTDHTGYIRLGSRDGPRYESK